MEDIYETKKITNNHISANRIGKIKNIIVNTTPQQLDLIISDVKDSHKAIIYATQKQNTNKNKIQSKYLKEFINNHIASLNNAEILKMTAIIEYYETLFDKHNGDIEEDYIMSNDNNRMPLGKRIERLLQFGSLLPDYRKKNEFIEEMDTFIIRLKNYVENHAKKNGFSLRYITADILLDFIRNDTDDNLDKGFGYKGNYDLSYGTEIKNSYLKSVFFNVSLPELNEAEEGFIETNEMGNHIKFEIVYAREGDEGVSKEEFINFMNEKGHKSDGGIYTLGGNDHIQIKLIPYNKIINNYGSESFSIEIYAQKQKNNISSELFLELAIHEISYKTEKLINDIYKKFGHPKQHFLFDMEMLIDDMQIFDEEESNNGGLKLKDNYNNYPESNKSKKINKDNTTKETSSDIILKQVELEILETIIDEINNPDDYIDSGINPTKGVVLHGPAGTGKTLFAEHVSNKIDGEFMIIKPSEIMSEYVSVSEKNLQRKFEEAKSLISKSNKKRVVMFFDEADSFFEKSGSQDNHKGGMINIFLSATDGIDKSYLDNIIIIFTTNRLQVIPEAILDRLNLKIKIDLPDIEQRVKHFKLNIDNVNSKATNNNFDNIDYDLLAQKTEGKSGRFINRLIENTVRNFVRNRRKQEIKHEKLITTQDIINGISTVETLENTSKGIGFHANIK